MKKTQVPTGGNQDEFLESKIGNFHKSLPHNEFGEVDANAYEEFRQLCLNNDQGLPKIVGAGNNQYRAYFAIPFDNVQRGSSPLFPNIEADGFVNPQAGAAAEVLGVDPSNGAMLPAPGILSASSSAEMVELYWMALLRDIPLANYESEQNVADAINEIRDSFQAALDDPQIDVGRLQLGLDLPVDDNGNLDISAQTLFRCGLKDEEYGPLISQFFLRDVPYGVQGIETSMYPYIADENFLTGYDDWLLAQNTAKDKFDRGYGQCNNYEDQKAGNASYYPVDDEGKLVKRHVSTIRDLARFVNRDALHQAYFNAALFLGSIGAPATLGNPYAESKFPREGGFGTLGGPDLLTLVSEVASRALKLIWRQKWYVHRRCRPENYGGLVQFQVDGIPENDTYPDKVGMQKNYGLSPIAIESDGAQRVKEKYGTYFLPMAFSAGSPNHPAYGAGHATVAGACVTVLKAWFDEDANFAALLRNAQVNEKDPGHSDPNTVPSGLEGLLQPGDPIGELPTEKYQIPQSINTDTYPDAENMTVGGELNKLASNVAMGRSMGGVHWRSDNTRSLRLGEELAIEILRKRTLEYAEQGNEVSFQFTSFDRANVFISQGNVSIS